MNEQVTIDFNAGGNLGASLSQMIQQSTEAAKVTDGLVGQIGRLNVVTLALVSRTTALTGANKVAVAQAAAYQEAMSGIAATAAVTGQNFQKLENTTLKLARSIPGGMGEAVRIVQTLQSSGVTAEESIAKLGKAFANLGKANGVDGAALGKELLSLGRVFGNSESSLEKFGDSLTGVSKKFGASVEGTLSFAKALAPVASSVGMSQTAVMGLSAAAARLGEDGYAGANAFNKVLLDMQRSVRDGTPELKEYASVLGVSSASLKDMFKQDPTEVLLRFTEAIKKNSPELQRSLEGLGFDSTRTVRSLRAISSQGNLRDVVESSSKEFSGGSTAKGAESAMSGVNAQAKILGETLSQTVASAGKPYLDWLGKVLEGANAAAGGVAKLAESSQAQTAGKIAPVVSTAAGLGMNAFGMASTGALGLMAYRGLKNFGGNFMNSATQMNATGTSNVGGVAGSLGKAAGFMGVTKPPAPKRPSLRQIAKTTFRGVMNSATTATNVQSSSISNAMGQSSPTSTAGQAFRAGMTGVGTQFKADASALNFKTAVANLTTTTASASKAFLTAEGSTMQFAKAVTRASLLTAQATAKAGLAVGGAAASKFPGGLGGLGQMALIGGALAGASYLNDQGNQSTDRINTGLDASKDAYGKFNEFAAAADLTSKGLVTFSEALTKTTKEIQTGNKTLKDAFEMTAAERENAASPGYTRAFTANSTDAKSIATQAQLMLGPNAAPEAIARVGMDVTNQIATDSKFQSPGTTVDEVLRLLKDGLKNPDGVIGDAVGAAGDTYSNMPNFSGFQGAGKMVSDVKDGNFGALGEFIKERMGGEDTVGVQKYGMRATATQGTEDIIAGIQATITRNSVTKSDQYGEGAGTLSQLSDLKKVYDKAAALKPDDKGRQAAQDILGRQLGVDSRDVNFDSKDFGALMRQNKESPLSKAFTALTPQGPGIKPYDLDKPDYFKIASTPEAEKSAQKLQDQFDKITKGITKSGGDLVESLYGVGRAARTGGRASYGASAVATYLKDATPKNLQVAGTSLAQSAVSRSGDVNQGILALQAQRSGESMTSLRRTAINTAIAGLQSTQQVQQSAQTMSQRTGAAMLAGRQAQAQGPYDTQADEQDRQKTIAGEQAAFGERLSFMRAFVQAYKDLNLQLKRSDEDVATNKRRMAQSFNTSKSDAKEDYTLGRARASEDFNTSKKRATDDYNLGVARAEEDNRTSRERAERDFNKNAARSQEEFNKQRLRSIRDFNKSVRRMMEDQAASIYDPYKRIQAQQVWDARSLLTNLKEQNAALLKQTENIAKAKKLGLSQAVIDQLKLSDASNAQQLERILQDAQSDPSVVAGLNGAATQRADATQGLVEQGKDFRHMTEDFQQGLKDSSADFATSQKNARADFATSMRDGAVDFQKSLARGATDFQKSMGRSFTDFVKSMARGETDYKKTLARAKRQYLLTLTQMDEDLKKSRTRAQEDLVRMGDEVGGGVEGVVKQFTNSIAAMPLSIRGKFSENLRTIWSSASGDLKSFLDTYLSPYGLSSDIFSGKSPSDAGGGEHGGNQRGQDNKPTPPAPPPADRGRHAQGVIALGAQEAIIGEAGPEAVIPLNSTGSSFMADTIARLMGPAAGAPSADERRKQLRMEDDFKRMKDQMASDAKRAKEQIERERADAKKKMDAMLKQLEAERKKKSLEKNHHVATADLRKKLGGGSKSKGKKPMLRSVPSGEIHAARTAHYSSPVTNNNTYHYDNRTQFTGNISVKANDPNKMVDELRKKVAHARLVSPGSAAKETSF
jgi:hypothetical protein